MITSAIYRRVSAATQHTENQIPELRAYAAHNQWEVIEYVEKSSPKKGARRPVLAQLLEDAKGGKFQVVLCWKMAGFGRSIKDFVANIAVLNKAGVRFICTSQPIDTDPRSRYGKMTMMLLLTFAEFEHDLGAERVQLGVARSLREQAAAAKAGRPRRSKSGKNMPHGAPRKIWPRGRVAEMRAQGMSFRKIAAELGSTNGSVRRAFEENRD